MSTRRKDRAGLVAAIIAMIACCLLPSAAVQNQSANSPAKAEPRSVKDEVALARAYLIGRGVERDDSRAAYWYEKAANSGDPDAQRILAHLYQMGLGVPRDPVQAVRWLERAVASGSMEAKVDLATNYLWGAGVKKDVQLSATWFREAAAKGSGRAATYLGDMYHFGIGTPIDDAGARHWYEIGAKRNDGLGQYRLGLLLLTDRSDSASARAADLLRKAANSGLVAAKYSLGVLLSEKPDLAVSPNEGESAIEEAAAAGMWKASITLGAHAFNGTPGPRNPKRAYFWLEVARLQGGVVSGPVAGKYLDALSLELTASETQEVDAAADRWFEGHNVPLQYNVRKPSDGQQDISFTIAAPSGEAHGARIDLLPKDDAVRAPF